MLLLWNVSNYKVILRNPISMTEMSYGVTLYIFVYYNSYLINYNLNLPIPYNVILTKLSLYMSCITYIIILIT